MRIVLVSPPWRPADSDLVAALIGIEHAVSERVAGCSAIPTICAIDDGGYLRKEWRPDQSIDRSDIATYAAMDGTPLLNEAPIDRALVSKTVIVDRLHAAGRLNAARAALDAADLYTRERWNVRSAIYSDDETARALLVSIGADPDIILAKE